MPDTGGRGVGAHEPASVTVVVPRDQAAAKASVGTVFDPSQVALDAVVQPGLQGQAEPPGRVLEATAAEAAQHLITFMSEHDEVDLPVAVDVDGKAPVTAVRSLTGDATWLTRKAPPIAPSWEQRRRAHFRRPGRAPPAATAAVERGRRSADEVSNSPPYSLDHARRRCVIDDMGRGSARRGLRLHTRR